MLSSVKYFLLCLLLIINFANVNAQERIEDVFLPNSHKLSIVWDFKGDIIVRQIDYNYLLNQYVGIGCGLGVWRESEAGSVFSQDFWEEDKGLGRFFLNSRSFLKRCFSAIWRFSSSVLTIPPSERKSFSLPSNIWYLRNSHSKLPLYRGILILGFRPIWSKHSSR